MNILISYHGECVGFDFSEPEDIADMISYVATIAAVSKAPKTVLEDMKVVLTEDGEKFLTLGVSY